MAMFRVYIILLVFLACAPKSIQACIDSMKIRVTPVQCYGLRNGKINIDSVYGGEGPFYFSLDGATWSTRPEFDRLWSGSYQVSVRNSSGCVLVVDVEVPEPPLLTVQLFADRYTIKQGESVEVTAVVDPPDAPLAIVSWRPPDLPNISGNLILHTVLYENTAISVSVETPDGCAAWDQVDIEVEKPQIYIPNAFQPSNVLNAYFTIYSDFSVSNIRFLQVYDRGGALLFERRNFWPNDPPLGWNGRWRDKPVSPGVYTWVAEIEFNDGHIEKRQGSVTVL